MKQQKRPELILSLQQVTGEARKLISAHVQARLFAFGYGWQASCGDTSESKNIQHTSRETLRVFSPDWNRLDITFADGEVCTSGGANFYNIAQVTDFLRRAEDFATIKTNVHGVDVTIRGNSVDHDPSRLLVDVSEHAKQLQRENFS